MKRMIGGIVLGLLLTVASQANAAYQEQQITGFGSDEVSFVSDGTGIHQAGTNVSALFSDVTSGVSSQVGIVVLKNAVSWPEWLVQNVQLTIDVSSPLIPSSGTVQLQLWSTGGSSYITYTGNWSDYTSDSSVRTYNLTLDASGDNATSVSDVEQITLLSTSNDTSVQVGLNNLKATPEPGICILTGMGLLALVLWRGKHRRMSGSI
jgi:hypothetical protein